jgi:nucleotide-binding universal stress UspA family protein
MYRRILVPVDGSAASKQGMKHAAQLAKEQHARLRVLNVVDDMALAPMMDGYPVADMTMLIDSMKASGQKALDESAAIGQKSGIRVEAAMIEARGRAVSESILTDAQKFRADLIVMGTHGRRGMNRLLLGSDAERVLRDSPVPVLLIREQESKRTPRVRRKDPGRAAAPR